MSHIAIDINHQQLTATVDHPLIARSVGETTFAVTADESWDGHAITIIFATAHVQKSCLYTGGEMVVPWEALDLSEKLWISAVGYAPGKRRPTAHMQQGLVIAANGRIEGGPPSEYTPALWEQVMAKLDGMGTGGGGSSAGAEAAQAKAEAAQKKAEAAQAAAETAAQTAAGEATKAAEEASNAAKFAGSATESAEAAQDAQAKAEGAQQAAEMAKEGAEEAKGAAEAILESIPTPKPTGADDGKVPVARDGVYRLEEIAAGGGGGEAEIIADTTLQEAAAYTWQGAGVAERYRKIIIDIACLAQEANVNTANANIFGNPIATYYINAATKNNRKTTIEVEIINSSTAIFRRSGINTSSPDPMDATTYITVDNQLISTASVDTEKPLLRIPAELPAGTQIRILGVRK